MVTKLPSTTRSHQVTEYFETLIRQHIYEPGDKLPTLQEMARVLGVSKSTIREGLAALAAHGLIEVRHGSGYFVHSLQRETPDNTEPKRDLGQVLFVRLQLEVPAAKLAAKNRTDEDLHKLGRCLDRMRLGSLSEAISADLEFHLVVAEASGNGVLRDVIASLSEQTRSTIKYSRALAGTEGDLFQKHVDLFEAIRVQDDVQAESLMHAHLYDTAQRLRVLVRGEGSGRSFK